MEICVKGVTKRFNDVVALDNVDLVFKEGVYGLIGPNGAGKSTLIKCLVTQLETTNGEIVVDGKVVNYKSKDFQNQIGLMPQVTIGFDEFSGQRFLYYMATLKGLSKSEAEQQIDKYTTKLNIKKYLGKKIRSYSGGMKQRLMLVQALLGDPKILILDEPTSGLDPYERINLRNYISEISSDKIIIIATHIMQDIESIANSIVLINDGKIIKQGSPESLINSLTGMVHEQEIPECEFTSFVENKKVSRVSKANEKVYIRYVSEELLNEHQVFPSLEEVYLYYLT